MSAAERDPSLPSPRSGRTYGWDEPHPYLGQSSTDGLTRCVACGAQSREHGHHLYPPPHAFAPYAEYGWRLCVHCGECRVNMQHPEEKDQLCGYKAAIGGPQGTAVYCIVNTERYPEHTMHSGRVTLWIADRYMDGTTITWRRRNV